MSFIMFIQTLMFELAVIAVLVCFYIRIKSRKVITKIKLLKGGMIPEYKTEGAACADCYCRLEGESITIPPFKSVLIRLGFALEVPEGYKTVIDPRSSYLYKEGGLVCHGEIDNDYRGELKANVINLNPDKDIVIKNGQRICQLQVAPVHSMYFELTDELSDTKRGTGSFGSTGNN